MARKSGNRKNRNKRADDDRPILTSRTVAFTVLALAVLGLVSARYGLGPEAESTDTAGAVEPFLTEPPPVLGPATELTSLDGWINTEATGLGSFGGQVRVVQFWTFGCYNCKNTLPHVAGIYNRWQPRGLEIIGVHAPEFDYEADPNNVSKAVAELGIVWPVALDTSKANFRSWQGDRRFWPRTYVLDQNGNIRFDHIGEGAYEELEATVAWLIDNGP
jgi:thiol-disulfide isomerase/thioredoxin